MEGGACDIEAVVVLLDGVYDGLRILEKGTKKLIEKCFLPVCDSVSKFGFRQGVGQSRRCKYIDGLL